MPMEKPARGMSCALVVSTQGREAGKGWREGQGAGLGRLIPDHLRASCANGEELQNKGRCCPGFKAKGSFIFGGFVLELDVTEG